MNVLVTGGGGFLGRYVVEQLLARGDHVRVYCRGAYPELGAMGVDVVRGDLAEREPTLSACADVEEVHHVAGLAGIGGRAAEFESVNVRGTENILAGCFQHGVKRLVYTSSPSVTFGGGDQCGVNEDAPYARRWLCHYARTKAEAERQVLAANGRQALLTCALRPHLIWGPRDQSLVPRLLARARAGQLRRVGDGINRIDTIYVENAARAQLAAAEALVPGGRVAGRAYFLSQGEPVNCWGWVDEVLALAGLAPVRRAVPLGVAWYSGAMLEAMHWLTQNPAEPRMTRFLAAQLGRSHWFDISRARNDFGYRPWVSIEEGMQRLAKWMGKNSSAAPGVQ